MSSRYGDDVPSSATTDATTSYELPYREDLKFQGNRGVVRWIQVEGNRLYTACKDRSLMIFDVHTCRPIQRLENVHSGEVNHLRVRNGTIWSCGDGGNVCVTQRKGKRDHWRTTCTWTAHEGKWVWYIWLGDESFDGSHTAYTAGHDCTIAKWLITYPTDAIRPQQVATFLGHQGGVTMVKQFPELEDLCGGTVISCGGDGTVRIWQESTYAPVHTIRCQTSGYVYYAFVDFRTKRIFATGDANCVHVINVGMQGCQRTHTFAASPRLLRCVKIHRGYVITSGGCGHLAVWEPNPTFDRPNAYGHTPHHLLRRLTGENDYLYGFQAMSKWVYAGGSDGNVYCWAVDLERWSWSRDTHCMFPAPFRRSVWGLLLLVHRVAKTGELPWLPRDALDFIIRWAAREE